MRRGSRPRRRPSSYSLVPAVERLESKLLLSAITLGDDSFQMQQASPTEVRSFEWDVLANDSSLAGGLVITGCITGIPRLSGLD